MTEENIQIKKIKEGFMGQKMVVLPPKVQEQAAKNPLTSGLYLTAVGYYPKASFHDRVRKGGSAQYIMLYCVEGQGTIRIRDKEFHLPPNHYFIIPRNVPHHYQSSVDDPWSIYWVHFEGTNSELLYRRYAAGEQAKVFPIPYDEHRIGVFDQLFDILEKSFDSRSLELVNFLLAQFLASFIYHVIKPALVGLCGPWISGGIEFNWPQHHRPSTFEPVDFQIRENPQILPVPLFYRYEYQGNLCGTRHRRPVLFFAAV